MPLNCGCKKTSIPGDLIASGEVTMNGSFQLDNGWRFNKEALLYTPKDHKDEKGDD